MGTSIVMIWMLVVVSTTGSLQEAGPRVTPPLLQQEVAARVRAILDGADGPEAWNALAVAVDGRETVSGGPVSAAGASARAVADSLSRAGPGIRATGSDRLRPARAALGAAFRASFSPVVGIALVLAWVSVLLVLRAAGALRMRFRGARGANGVVVRTNVGSRSMGSGLDRRGATPHCRDAARLRARIRTTDVASP